MIGLAASLIFVVTLKPLNQHGSYLIIQP